MLFSKQINITLKHAKRCIIQSSRLGSNTASEDRASTVDSAELDGFAGKAAVWWELEGPSKDLHTLNKLRVPFIFENITNSVSQSLESSERLKILEVGCGGGILSEALAKCNASVTGIDASRELIDIADRHARNNKELKVNPTYICTTIEAHAQQYKSHYDKVVASEVIEHITNKELFVKSCVEALKPGGKIFFTCPSKTRISQLVTILFCENVFNSPPKGTHQYEKFITPSDLRLLLERNGCEVEEIRGFAHNLFTRDWAWTRNTSIYFATRAVKIK